ncbi:hypothetical protein ANRL3_01115 [Anaerolineae bacterium]|nr:hypothetical protein ANRL3_01115 [Anaerolineae bacterium]
MQFNAGALPFFAQDQLMGKFPGQAIRRIHNDCINLAAVNQPAELIQPRSV